MKNYLKDVMVKLMHSLETDFTIVGSVNMP